MNPATELQAPNRPQADVNVTFSSNNVLVITANVDLLAGISPDAKSTEIADGLNIAINYICGMFDGEIVLTPEDHSPIAYAIQQVKVVDGVVSTRVTGTSSLTVKMEPESSHSPVIAAFCRGLRASGYSVLLEEYIFAASR